MTIGPKLTVTNLLPAHLAVRVACDGNGDATILIGPPTDEDGWLLLGPLPTDPPPDPPADLSTIVEGP
jgi:hypothetical protein